MCYKATFFVTFGVLIHFFFGGQDWRVYLCNLYSFILLFTILFFIGLDSCSIWFLFGFYVKEFCLWGIFFGVELYFIFFIFLLVSFVYNIFLLMWFRFVFGCCFYNDGLFFSFDFEICILYCFTLKSFAFIGSFFFIDFLFYTAIHTIYMDYFVVFHFSFFDVVFLFFIITIILFSRFYFLFLFVLCLFDIIFLCWRCLIIFLFFIIFLFVYFYWFVTVSLFMFWSFYCRIYVRYLWFFFVFCV